MLRAAGAITVQAPKAMGPRRHIRRSPTGALAEDAYQRRHGHGNAVWLSAF